jgi:flagellar hook assembly protein FlgD
LSQASPNPFYTETVIRYAIPVKSEASLRVYDLSGRLIATLVDREVESGMHVASWNGRDAAGSIVPAGVYLYRLAAGDYVAARKLILLR